MTRAEYLDAFISDAGWAGSVRNPLAGDASPRRYLRLVAGAASAILMDADPARGSSVPRFLDVNQRLTAAGIRAPLIRAKDSDAGLLMLEDFGDTLFARHLASRPEDEKDLYTAAIDVLIAVATRPGLPDGLPPYSIAVALEEAARLLRWYLPRATGAETSATLQATYLDQMTVCLTPVLSRPAIFVHRDYHAENLFWLPDAAGLARVGVIDHQDALAGPPGYDLASLLFDARRDTRMDLWPTLTARYAEALGRDVNSLTADMAVLSLQRNLKILGIFARLAIEEGKPNYLALMPRVWGHIEQALSHPSLAALASWVEDHVPPPDTAVLARFTASAGPA